MEDAQVRTGCSHHSVPHCLDFASTHCPRGSGVGSVLHCSLRGHGMGVRHLHVHHQNGGVARGPGFLAHLVLTQASQEDFT